MNFISPGKYLHQTQVAVYSPVPHCGPYRGEPKTNWSGLHYNSAALVYTTGFRKGQALSECYQAFCVHSSPGSLCLILLFFPIKSTHPTDAQQHCALRCILCTPSYTRNRLQGPLILPPY